MKKAKKTYKMHPILTCWIEADRGTFTYRTGYGQMIKAPVYSWLIEGGEEPFLIDAGCTIKEAAKLSAVFAGEEGPPIEDSLRKKGLSPGDIKTVILTHLHIDHFGNARKFPNARFIVQEEELKFARNPHPVFAKSYNKAWYEGLNFETVRGDMEIFPGIEVLSTPGHSPGTQSLSIDTDEGRKLLCGFCSIDESFSDKGDIVSGIFCDIFKAYDSIQRLKSLGTIIPLHSERVLRAESASGK